MTMTSPSKLTRVTTNIFFAAVGIFAGGFAVHVGMVMQRNAARNERIAHFNALVETLPDVAPPSADPAADPDPGPDPTAGPGLPPDQAQFFAMLLRCDALAREVFEAEGSIVIAGDYEGWVATVNQGGLSYTDGPRPSINALLYALQMWEKVRLHSK